MTPYLKRLEDEAVHIFREVVAECRAPVMLYSVGKDSAVMLHLAQLAFAPAPLPFPLLHVDTGWKFREMIALRDQTAREHGLRLIVHTNRDGQADLSSRPAIARMRPMLSEDRSADEFEVSLEILLDRLEMSLSQ